MIFDLIKSSDTVKKKNISPGLNNIMLLKHPSSVLSIFISRIFATSSVSTLSNIPPTPTWCAEFLKEKDIVTNNQAFLYECSYLLIVRPVANTMPSLDSMERCENAAMSNSFQPALNKSTWSCIGSEVKWGICFAQSTSWNSCLLVAWQKFVTGFWKLKCIILLQQLCFYINFLSKTI